jgi:outer membrane protein
MNPIVEKAKTAIQTVAKAQGCTAVFDTSSGALLYQNDATMINLLPLVKKELGITDAPAASTPAKK